jgi:hypothetical protein
VEPQFVTSSLSGQNHCVEVAAVPASYVKSSRSEGVGACVEVAVNLTRVVKSRLSNPNGSCVEADVSPDGCVLVCDSKDRGKPPLHHHIDLWEQFIEDIKAGRYDYGRLTTTPLTTSCCPRHGTISITLEDSTVRMTHSLQPDHDGHIYTRDEWLAFVGNEDGPDKGGAKGDEFDLVKQDGRHYLQRQLTLAAAAS